jgi:hypothetical protein
MEVGARGARGRRTAEQLAKIEKWQTLYPPDGVRAATDSGRRRLGG